MSQVASKGLSGRRLFVPSLTVAFFSTMILESLTSIFLLDVTSTFFGVPNPAKIATAGQLVTLSSTVAIFFGVLLGFLSVRYNHKLLLLMGILGITVGALGCYLAPSYLVMQIFFSVEGIGSAIVVAMAFALVGEFLDLNRRPTATGWVIAGASMAGIASAVVVNFFFSGQGGWRSFLLWFALPISLVALAAAFIGVPSAPQKPIISWDMGTYLSSFRQVFLRRSASACLVGNLFRYTLIGYNVVYSATFLRDRFGLSVADAALYVLGMTVLFTLVR